MHKRITSYLVAVILAAGMLSTLSGCAAKTATTPTTLPVAALDQTDATVYRILMDAQAFLTDIRGSVSAGTLTMTATQKTAFNGLVTAYNTTEALWQAYHSGQSKDSAGLSTSAQTLNTNLAAAQGALLVTK